MKKFALAALASVAAAPAYAVSCPITEDNCVAVPEISALEGTAALAVIATVVLLAWERRRRSV